METLDGKIRTTIYLDKTLKQLVEIEQLNLSKWVNHNLAQYFSVTSIEELKNRLSHLDQERQILLSRIQELEDKGVAATREEAVRNHILVDLQEAYRNRRDSGIPADFDYNWCNSPKNRNRIHSLGWDVDTAVKKLREWYEEDSR